VFDGIRSEEYSRRKDNLFGSWALKIDLGMGVRYIEYLPHLDNGNVTIRQFSYFLASVYYATSKPSTRSTGRAGIEGTIFVRCSDFKVFFQGPGYDDREGS
jgi:hypothetical protein